jgi:hypothetical protein
MPTVTTPNKQKKVSIAAALKKQAKTQPEKQVIIHCKYEASSMFDAIRIWPNTCLLDKHTSHISNMVHFENISLAPVWKTLSPYEIIYFTLIFEGLPKSCTIFDFIEFAGDNLPGFEKHNMQRNMQDVYHVNIV